MKVNLRKAHALMGALALAATAVQIPNAVVVGRYDDVKASVDVAVAEAKAAFELRADLVRAVSEMRAKVGQANAASGVNDILVNANYFANLSKILEPLTTVPVRKRDIGTFAAELNDLVNQPVGTNVIRYQALPPTITVPLYDPAQIGEFVSNLRQAKRNEQDEKDKLLNINITTEIELSAETEALLKRYNLV